MLVVLVFSVIIYGTVINGQDQGPQFNAGVGYMFKALATNIFEQLQGKNVSVCGDLLTKITFLNGGMKQLISVAQNKSPQVFDSIKPIIRDIMEHGKPQFEKIKFEDEDLMRRFAWNGTQIAQFHELHADISSMLKKLENICKHHNYEIN